MMTRRIRAIPPLLILTLLATGITAAPGPQAPPVGAAPLTALMDRFPKIEGEVVEVRDGALMLGAGVKAGARPGLEVELFREGREINPKTGAVLGHAEEPQGVVRISSAREAFSVASAPTGVGDQARGSVPGVLINGLVLKASDETQIIMTVPQE